ADFVAFWEKRQPDWCILAVATAVEELTPALAASRGAVRTHLDVAEAVEAATQGVFVVQFHGHRWSLELRELGWRTRSADDADRQAVELSRRLGTDAVVFAGSDTAGSWAVTLYRD